MFAGGMTYTLASALRIGDGETESASAAKGQRWPIARTMAAAAIVGESLSGARL
jgi:hypothetical protein